MTDNARKVLRVSGPEARPFLQGLVTNDVEKLDHGMVYAAMLTPQGKLRTDFFLVPDSGPGGEDILIDAPASEADGLLRLLTMYKLRSAVTVTETGLTVTRGLGMPPEGGFADPRDAAMGWRSYNGQPDEDVDWNALRVAAQVPEMGVELTPDTFILEVGFERLNGVDFKKGCYVGQEVTARMKHKTELRKGLARVRVEGAAPLGTEITANGKSVGTLYTQSGGEGLAYLRFDRAGPEMTAEGAQVRYPA
ncbi:YgfZ/GcvT domain-containing protein [Sagittula salina]|uniref:Folate-binding protein YgfZ n=1 Tax=Sagittula salina TaxID=2820268 RepID=A0A940S410_9RHOB|nr:folate-binding protein YgfZ [Sagittula salina]MBP0483380.1 folate-binding protein YgfZ [Sagittula salina]